MVARGPMIPNHIDPLAGSRYRREMELGSGTFGAVRCYTDTQTGERVAVKFIDRSSMTKYMEREILNHHALMHPNVIRFKARSHACMHACMVTRVSHNLHGTGLTSFPIMNLLNVRNRLFCLSRRT